MKKKYWVQDYKVKGMFVIGDNESEICYTHNLDAAMKVAEALNKLDK